MKHKYIIPHTELIQGSTESLMLTIGSIGGDTIPEGGYLAPIHKDFLIDDEEYELEQILEDEDLF